MREAQKFHPAAITDADFPAGVEDRYIPINGLRVPYRNSENVARLNTVCCDIDFHDNPRDAWGIALEINRLERLLIEQRLPMPSCVVQSGRGFWCHFFLREFESRLAVAASRDAVERWSRATASFLLWLRANGFPVDPVASSNSCGLTRLPNSINGNNGALVKYSITIPALLYTLDQIEAAFPAAVKTGFVDEPTPSEYASHTTIYPRTTERVPARGKGRKALYDRRKADMRLLLELRGRPVGTDGPATGSKAEQFRGYDNKVVEGGRHYFAVILAAMTGKHKRAEMVANFGKNACSPPMSKAEIKRALDQKVPKIRDIKIGQWLSITPEENARLVGDYLTPKPRRAESKGRTAAGKERREKIASLLVENGPRSSRAIAKALGLSRGSVIRDLKALAESHESNT